MSDDSSILRIAQPGSGNFREIAEVESHTGYSWNASVRSDKIFLRKKKILMKFRSFTKKEVEKTFVQLAGRSHLAGKIDRLMESIFLLPSALKIRLIN